MAFRNKRTLVYKVKTNAEKAVDFLERLMSTAQQTAFESEMVPSPDDVQKRAIYERMKQLASLAEDDTLVAAIDNELQTVPAEETNEIENVQ